MKRAANPICRLSKRAQKLLTDNGIETLEDLCSKTWLEVHRLPGCGHKTGSELDEILKINGLVYRVDEPRNDFVNLHERLKAEYNATSDFREMGAHYGINADIMYQIYLGAERAERMYQKTLAEHTRWRSQFGDRPSE